MGGFLTALTFLTTAPVGAPKSPAKGDLGRAVVWFPVVGMLVGLALAGVDWGARTAWDARVAAALILGANLLITGGLHVDGLMDTADALFSRASRERMLEIMRDARAGALGVAAGSCVLLVKFAAYAHLAGEGHWRVITAVPVVGRMAMVVTLVGFPYARSAGVGHGFASEAGWRHLVGAAVLCSAICAGLFGIAGLGLVGIGLGLAAVVGLRVSTRIGGVTGDVYGAVNELVEVGVLLLGAAILARPA